MTIGKRRAGKWFKLALAVVVVVGAYRWFSKGEPVMQASSVTVQQLLDYEQPKNEAIPYVMTRLASDAAKDTKESKDDKDAGIPTISIAPSAYSSADEQAAVSTNGSELRWSNELGWVEWQIDVPQEGQYELHFDYMPLPGGKTSIIRGIQIDGSYPFAEAERVELERQWKDAKFPYDRNAIGQEIRPEQQELGGWTTKPATDYAASSEPLLFHLTAGKHTLRLVGGRESVAIRALSFTKKQTVPDYRTYREQQKHEALTQQWYSKLEAERFQRKSSLAIQTDYRSEPYISPDPKGRIVYNTLGGQRWRLPGEWVEWTFNVPQDGWYEMDMKVYTGFRSGFKAYRTIAIDGKVPFQELLHYGFASNKDFKIETLAGEDGAPYQFYLTAGEHKLRMTADASMLQPVYLALKDTLEELTEFDRYIRQLTGNYSKLSYDANLDTTRTWDMLKFDPNVEKRMDGFIARMNEIRAYIDGLNGRDSDLSQAVKASVSLLAGMVADVNEIPNKINDFATIQSKIGTWMSELTQQPLLLDYMVVRSPDAATGFKEPTAWSRIPYAITDFGRSFYMDYDLRKHNKKEALTIWVQRGRDYVDLLRELAEQDFTPKTGIEVNINLMPNPNMLILGNAAGEVPDVALGVGEATPADFAMRKAVYDLSQFSDFKDVNKQFIPGVDRALSYNGGTYGLPEVQNFQMLFYRTDILDNLNLKAPDTWEDVFDLMPTLQENGMTMSVPKGDFTTQFFQHGAEIYSPDGLKASLSSEQGQQAFKRWTELFAKYNLPIDIPAFFQHFRDGDIPIGIADFNTYVQLLVAAPEITGHWQIAPLPGMADESGQIVRWSPQAISAAMMMEKSTRKEDAWTFLKWWTSAEVQARYASDIESFYGIEYRWNTANVEAMKTLSWPSADLAALREQARWAKNMPYVPGYYFLAREMEFAWNRTVLDGVPAQESLSQAQLSVQREMDRRQQDFGLTKQDNLQIPQITSPYEWRE